MYIFITCTSKQCLSKGTQIIYFIHKQTSIHLKYVICNKIEYKTINDSTYVKQKRQFIVQRITIRNNKCVKILPGTYTCREMYIKEIFNYNQD